MNHKTQEAFSFQKNQQASMYVKTELIGITLAVFGVIGLALIYFYVIAPLYSKLQKIETSIDSIETRITQKQSEYELIQEQLNGKILGAKENDKQQAVLVNPIPDQAKYNELVANLSAVADSKNGVELLEIKRDEFIPHAVYQDLSILPLYISIKVPRKELNNIILRFEETASQLFEILSFQAVDIGNNEVVASFESEEVGAETASSSSSLSDEELKEDGKLLLRLKVHTFYGFTTQPTEPAEGAEKKSGGSSVIKRFSESKGAIQDYWGDPEDADHIETR